jgi:hypothetical protein
MAVVNRTVDKIVELEETQQRARTVVDYLRAAQHIFDLRKAFFAELAEIQSLVPPSGAAVS